MKVKTGIIVVDHGSKSLDAIDEFNHVVAAMRLKLNDSFVIGAHMEINDPDIPKAIDLLLEQHIKEIVVVPYFLFMGKHIKNDIPSILRAKKKLHPNINIQYQSPIGTHPLIADILIERALGATFITI